ncbi:FAD-dependent monooxygenase [Gammaproteobacteria bacterium]|nr:FAD-dependent monooxygenase [Gammaproteobacteria bacterium]
MTDLVIIGAGFVGMSFALAAYKQGFGAEVYDKGVAPVLPKTATSQVIAVNPASAEFLSGIGVWNLIPDRFVTRYDQMSVFDGQGSGSISFTAEEGGLPCLGYIVDQVALRVAMNECALSQGLEVKWTETVDIDELQTDLLVAADGAHSATREKLGLKKIGYSYDQRATVCVAQFGREFIGQQGQKAYQWFCDSGPLALLPLSDQGKFAVVWSSSVDMASISETAFVSALEDSTEEELGSVQGVSSRHSFPLMQQQAWRYVTEGALLLGDAAHAIHPLAGQGANLGFADASCLVTELCAARLEGKGVGDLGVLRRYEKKRKTENHIASLAMEGFHQLFMSDSSIVGMVRSRGLRFVNENKTLKRLAISVASGRV